MTHRVEIEYCKNQNCRGHKGPNGTHAHVNLYRDDVETPIKSPAFGSRKAGTAMSFMMDEANASDEEKLISSIINSKVAIADLPETYGNDDEFVESFKVVQTMRPAVKDTILIIVGGGNHSTIDRTIDHNQHRISLTGCVSCGAIMTFYRGDRPMGYAEGVCTVDDAKHILDQAQANESYALSADDAKALHEKLPELFKA